MHAVSLREHPLAALRDRYACVRARTLALAAPLTAEDCALQSMPDASPAKWHLAHTTWFFETFVLEPLRRRVHRPSIRRSACCSTPTTTASASSTRGRSAACSRARRSTRCCAYRAHVDERMRALLAGRDAATPTALALVELGLHHEQQHQELIAHRREAPVLAQSARARRTARGRPLMPAARGAHGVAARIAGGVREVGHARRGLRVRQRDAAPSRAARAVRAGHRVRSPTANTCAFMRGRRLPAAGAVAARTAGTASQAQGWDAPLYWRRRDGGWHVVHAARRARRSTRTRRSRT